MLRRSHLAPVLLVAASLVSLAFLPGTGTSVPLFAARTGLQCRTCHFDPNGGGPRNEFGFAYAKNRHTLEPDTKEEWRDLDLRNRVADGFPLYLGLNQRFMLLANRRLKDEGFDNLGFWNMENALYATFQPHSRLTLVYNLEQTTGTFYQSRDAFALLGFGSDHYLKAGQFRVPFGLRLDDHTVATRNSFLDYQGGARFLPFDPRNVDRGVELGGARGNWHGRTSLTNGSASTGNTPPSTGRNPQAVTARLGYSSGWYQGAVSFYDDWVPDLRRTRWGYYALAHHGPFALLGEIAAGTDDVIAGGGTAQRNVMAGFAEANWTPNRAHNFRFRYDHLELDRSSDDGTRALNSWNRFSLEGEWVPVPFAELRWTVRQIDRVAAFDALGREIKDETQAYLQLHLSY